MPVKKCIIVFDRQWNMQLLRDSADSGLSLFKGNQCNFIINSIFVLYFSSNQSSRPIKLLYYTIVNGVTLTQPQHNIVTHFNNVTDSIKVVLPYTQISKHTQS